MILPTLSSSTGVQDGEQWKNGTVVPQKHAPHLSLPLPGAWQTTYAFLFEEV
jgi:hypothetical protein